MGLCLQYDFFSVAGAMIVTKLYSLGVGRTSGCRTQALSMIHLSQRHSSSTTQHDNGNQITGNFLFFIFFIFLLKQLHIHGQRVPPVV